MTRRYFAALAASLLAIADLVSAETVRADFHKSFPVEPAVLLSLKNVNGTVRISGWDRNEVRVDAIKRGPTQTALDEAEIVIDASQSSIRIETRYPREGRKETAGVEYTLQVPRAARLRDVETVNGRIELSGVAGEVNLRSVNGGIKARNLAGSAAISTVNGAVDAGFDKAPGASAINLRTVNGSVELALPVEARADVSASTVHGKISGELAGAPRGRRAPGATVQGSLGGGGGAQVRIHTVNGAIRIVSTAGGRRIWST